MLKRKGRLTRAKGKRIGVQRRAPRAAQMYWADQMKLLQEKMDERPVDERGARIPSDTRWSVLKAFCYDLVRTCREFSWSSLPRYVVWDRARSGGPPMPRGPTFEENPFVWALAAINGKGIPLTAWQIHVFGNQLLYADWHDIEPELLTGFIYQVGNFNELRKKMRNNDKEKWLPRYKARRVR